MFCPVCKSEYPPNSKVCIECNAVLIAELSAETSVRRPQEDVWYDEPVRSYSFAWLPTVAIAGIGIIIGIMAYKSSTLDSFISVVDFVAKVGALWMLYQVIRYEVHLLRYALLTILPFSFIWYYFERYSRRRGYQCLPIAMRERISPRPSA